MAAIASTVHVWVLGLGAEFAHTCQAWLQTEPPGDEDPRRWRVRSRGQWPQELTHTGEDVVVLGWGAAGPLMPLPAGQVPVVAIAETLAQGLSALRQGVQEMLLRRELTPGTLRRALHCALARPIGPLVCPEPPRFSPPLSDTVVSLPPEQGELIYQAIVETQMDVVVRSRPDTTITFVNDYAITALGWSPSVVGTPWADFLPPGERERCLLGIAHLSPQNPRFINEVQILYGPQQGQWYEWTSSGIFQGETLVEVLSVGRNINDRKQAEQALRSSELRHRALVEALPDLVMRMDSQGRYLDFFVPAGFRVYSTDGDHPIGKTVFDNNLPPNLATQRLQAIQQAIATDTVQVYEQCITIRGEECYEEVRVAPAGKDEVVVIVRDVTERNRFARELNALNHELENRIQQRTTALQESESRFRSIFEQSPIGIAITDLQGQVVRANPALCTMLGLPREAILHHLIQDILGFSLTEGEGNVFDTLFDRTLPMVSFEKHCFPPQGKPLWVKVIGTGLLDGFGRPSGFVHLVDNITAEKETSQALERINEQLVLTNAALYRATRLKDEFLANMSHELRTPLNAILGMAEALEEGIFEPINPRQAQAVTTIDTSGRHLLSLINDILDLSKVEAGKLELQVAPTEVLPLCQSSLTFVRQQAHKKHIHLDLEVPEDLPAITLDEQRIRQVLINLLSNAVKFTPDQGCVKLVAQVVPPPGKGERLDFHLQLSVWDTGIGIAPEDQSKLFQAFTQLDSSLNRRHEGTGLGLALVRRLVELHGGIVGVESTPGQGSHFFVCLPYGETEVTPWLTGSCPSPAHSPVPSPPETSPPVVSLPVGADQLPPLVLIAEDNDANAASIGDYLLGRGYRIHRARTGQEAHQVARTLHPALILMDIQMPEMDGIEATRHIRQDPALRHTPIIAITAHAMAQDRERCLAVGANDYMAKPLSLRALCDRIHAILSGSAEASHTPSI